MKLRTEKHGAAVVVELEGELDAEGSAELEQRCLYEEQEGARHFVVDLARLSRITGPGLRVLLGLARSLPRAGGSLVLCALERRIEEALEVSGLAGTFATAPDRGAALARSQELRSTGSPPPAPSAAQEKIDYAIELLGANGPAPD